MRSILLGDDGVDLAAAHVLYQLLDARPLEVLAGVAGVLVDAGDLVKSGRFIRVRRGLYRYREYPSSPRENVLAAWLAVGKEGTVVSHESALDLLDLSDVIPDAAHLTVPRSRRNLPTLPGVKIHTTVRPLRPGDMTYRDGMVVTSATRTILDAAEAGTAPDQIELAVHQAVERGLAAPDELRRGAAERGRRVAALIEGALRRVPV